MNNLDLAKDKKKLLELYDRKEQCEDELELLQDKIALLEKSLNMPTNPAELKLVEERLQQGKCRKCSILISGEYVGSISAKDNTLCKECGGDYKEIEEDLKEQGLYSSPYTGASSIIHVRSRGF